MFNYARNRLIGEARESATKGCIRALLNRVLSPVEDGDSMLARYETATATAICMGVIDELVAEERKLWEQAAGL